MSPNLDELSLMSLLNVRIGLHVVGEEHGRGLALLEHRLLIGLGRRVVVERELQLRAVRSSGEATVSQRNGAWLKSAFFTKPSTSV
jgi:hypothetical protein